MRASKWAILGCAGWVTLACAQQGTVLGPEATKVALADICERSRANFERIRTWRGAWSGQYVTFYHHPEDAAALDAWNLPKTVGDIRTESPIAVEFAMDLPSGRRFAQAPKNGVQLIDAHSSQRLRTTMEPWVGGNSVLLTPDSYLSVNEVGQDRSGRAVRQGQRERKPAPNDHLLQTDPQWLYGFHSIRSAWESLDEMRSSTVNRTPEQLRAAVATQPGEQGYWVEEVRAQSPRIYRVVDNFPGGSVQEYWFDEAAGFNFVRCDSTRGGVLRNHYEQSYKQERGVYLPLRIFREHFDKTGRIRVREEMNLTASTLNEPMPADQFTLQKLGLKDGERVIDNVSGGEYRYEAGTLTSKPAP
jgi:hypothetical protein